MGFDPVYSITEMSISQQVKQEILYPCKLESLFVIIGWSIAFYSFYFISAASYIFISGGTPIYWLGAYAWIIGINSFMEYGLDILERSSKGYNNPPTMRVDIILLLLGERRFLKQLLITIFLVSLAVKLNEFGHIFISVVSIIILIFILPASIAINAVSNSTFQMINPVSLTRFILNIGPAYFFSIIVLCVIAALVYFMFSGGGKYIYLSIVALMYLIMIFFRELGYFILLKREKFDFAVEVSPEIEETRRNEIIEKETEKVLSRVYKLNNVNRINDDSHNGKIRGTSVRFRFREFWSAHGARSVSLQGNKQSEGQALHFTCINH